MLDKIFAIAWNGIYRTYTDRTALMFMFLIPVALSMIITLAFGAPSENLPTSTVVVINQDEGTTVEGRDLNQGQAYVDILVENPDAELAELIDGEIGTDVAAERQRVDEGEIIAVLVIPPDFSQKLASGEAQGIVHLYYNPGSEIRAMVVNAVVEGITTTLSTMQAGQDVLLGNPDGYLIQQAIQGGETNSIPAVVDTTINQLARQRASEVIQLQPVNIEGELQEFDTLRYFAPSMAILFMTFAMAAGTRSILEEQRDWTLQRIITTPTPRWVYMFGRLLGTFASGLIQMGILLLITPVMAVMLGRSASVWGDNIIGIVLITIAVVAAATGLGLLIAAISKNSTQADTISSAVLLVLAMFGGTFIPTEGISVLDTIGNLSLNKWGILGYNNLANYNAPLGEVLPNIGILLLMAVAYFGVALWQFNRRLDI